MPASFWNSSAATQPIFAVAACAYLVALGVVHLIVPNYEAVSLQKARA